MDRQDCDPLGELGFPHLTPRYPLDCAVVHLRELAKLRERNAAGSDVQHDALPVHFWQGYGISVAIFVSHFLVTVIAPAVNFGRSKIRKQLLLRLVAL